MLNLIIAERIKSITQSKNLSLKKILEDCKINKGFIYDLEKRKSSPSSDKLKTIADYLNCSVDYLLGRTENENINSPDITPAIASNRKEKELLDMFRLLDYEIQEDIFDFIKLKYDKCMKKEKEKSCISTTIESDIA